MLDMAVLSPDQATDLLRTLEQRERETAVASARLLRLAPALAYEAEVQGHDHARQRLAALQKELAALRDEATRLDWAIVEARARAEIYSPRDAAKARLDTRLAQLTAEVEALRYQIKGTGLVPDQVPQALLDRFAAVTTERFVLAKILRECLHDSQRYGGQHELRARDYLAGSPILMDRLSALPETRYPWVDLVAIVTHPGAVTWSLPSVQRALGLGISATPPGGALALETAPPLRALPEMSNASEENPGLRPAALTDAPRTEAPL